MAGGSAVLGPEQLDDSCDRVIYQSCCGRNNAAVLYQVQPISFVQLYMSSCDWQETCYFWPNVSGTRRKGSDLRATTTSAGGWLTVCSMEGRIEIINEFPMELCTYPASRNWQFVANSCSRETKLKSCLDVREFDLLCVAATDITRWSTVTKNKWFMAIKNSDEVNYRIVNDQDFDQQAILIHGNDLCHCPTTIRCLATSTLWWTVAHSSLNPSRVCWLF